MSIYDFSARTINGEHKSLGSYQDKVVLIVNTASACRFTPQYEDLQRIYAQHKDKGFEVLGFPCNQFEEQEPGDNAEVLSFCQRNYGVDFQMFSKVEVRGENAHPLFNYLTSSVPFKGFDQTKLQAKIFSMFLDEKHPELANGNGVKWNFTKFLVNRSGKVVARLEPPTDIMDEVEPLVTMLL